MGTSLTTPNNAFRYPAGLVGEAPDVPDDIHRLALDLEAFLVNGNWFPTLAGGNGATAGTSAGSDGKYLKVGKHLSAKGRIIFGSSASFGTGSATISSFPGTADVNHSTGYGWFVSSGSPVPVMLVPTDGANFAIRPVKSSAAGSVASLSVAFDLGTPPQSSVLQFTLDITLT